jgi:hypothetical protein
MTWAMPPEISAGVVEVAPPPEPQHVTVPPDSKAHVDAPPAAIAVAPATPGTETGDDESERIP